MLSLGPVGDRIEGSQAWRLSFILPGYGVAHTVSSRDGEIPDFSATVGWSRGPSLSLGISVFNFRLHLPVSHQGGDEEIFCSLFSVSSVCRGVRDLRCGSEL